MVYVLQLTVFGLYITIHGLQVIDYGLRVYFTGSHSLLQNKTQDNLFTSCNSHNLSYRLRFISICLLVMTCMIQ